MAKELLAPLALVIFAPLTIARKPPAALAPAGAVRQPVRQSQERLLKARVAPPLMELRRRFSRKSRGGNRKAGRAEAIGGWVPVTVSRSSAA